MAKKSLLDNLLNMDYNALVQLTRKENLGELRSVVRHLTIQANRRINELNKDIVGEYSPALKYLDLQTEKLKTAKQINSLEGNDLMHQYSRLKKFLTAKSSTLKGWKNIRKNIGKRTNTKKLFATEYKSERSAKIWQNREKRFWKLYNELVDQYGGNISNLDSNRIQKMLSKIQTMQNKAKSNEDISMAMMYYIESLYRGDKINDEDFLQSLKTDEGIDEVRLYYDEQIAN